MLQSNLSQIILLVLAISFTACTGGNNAPSNETTPNHTHTSTGKEQPVPEGFKEDYEPQQRVIWQKHDLILNMLGDLSDKTVADIGAGRGYFTKLLAPISKKVIAIDIDPYFINYLDSIKVLELPQEAQARLETRLAQPDNPLLNNEEVDVILIVNTFSYIPKHDEYLQKLKASLKLGGQLLIVDFKKKRTDLGPPSEYRTPLYVVENEMIEAGFKEVTTNDASLDYQYMVIATK